MPLTLSWRCCRRTFLEVRSHSSLTRSPVSSRVQMTRRSVGVSQALDRRSDSSAVSDSLTYRYCISRFLISRPHSATRPEALLEKHKGSASAVSREAGIARSYLYKLFETHKLDPEKYRP